jgi:hypothetical protein
VPARQYRVLPRTAQLNAAQTAPNPVPLMIAVGENSFCNPLLPTFVEGCRAQGMTRVDSARIPDAGHYVLADNPEAVADLIERYARSDARRHGSGLRLTQRCFTTTAFCGRCRADSFGLPGGVALDSGRR